MQARLFPSRGESGSVDKQGDMQRPRAMASSSEEIKLLSTLENEAHTIYARRRLGAVSAAHHNTHSARPAAPISRRKAVMVRPMINGMSQRIERKPDGVINMVSELMKASAEARQSRCLLVILQHQISFFSLRPTPRSPLLLWWPT